MKRSDHNQRRLDTGRIWMLLSLLLLAAASGCRHRQGTVVETYHLQDTALYPLLVPSRSSPRPGGQVQVTRVNLGGIGLNLPAGTNCSIEGSIFSLRPPEPTAPALWLVNSPSVSEWETHGSEIDLSAKWGRFAQSLSSLQEIGCFGTRSNLAKNLRAIAESIPIPASELLLFYYSYNGTGAVDLVPGMQIRVERGVLQGRQGDQTMKSIEAQYEVIPGSPSGVALRLSQTSNRHLSRGSGEDDRNMFDLVRLTQTATMLRLFLQARTDQGVERKQVLLRSRSAAPLDEATRQLEANASSGCAAVNVNGASCVPFTKSAVSLMISCRINGKLSYKPLGTSVSQIIKDSQTALNSLVLSRSMTNGGYAELSFPRTLEAAGQLMLVNGDRLSW